MAKNNATPSKQSSTTGVFIRSVPERGFRRSGFFFTREGFGIACDALTDDQLAALRAEPSLIVEDVEFNDMPPSQGAEA